jgi:hypothetical protein
VTGGIRLPARRATRVAAVLALVAAVACGIVLLVAWTGGGNPKLDPQAVAAFEDQTGIRISRVAVTGGGGLIDFRYQVLDPVKAVVVHDRGRTPALVDERSGDVLDALWGHQGHSGGLRAGRTYFLLFVNPKGLIEPHRRLSIRVGQALLEHVIAQ